jgi:hypothetical protein
MDSQDRQDVGSKLKRNFRSTSKAIIAWAFEVFNALPLNDV